MSIIVRCNCGQNFRVADDMAGKKGRCPHCRQVLVVPSPLQDVYDDTAIVAPTKTPITRPPAQPPDPTSDTFNEMIDDELGIQHEPPIPIYDEPLPDKKKRSPIYADRGAIAESSSKYPALRAIAWIYRGLGMLVIIVGSVGFIVGLVGGTPGEAFLILPIMVIGSVSFFAMSEGISLLIDIEANTRRNSEVMIRMLQKR